MWRLLPVVREWGRWYDPVGDMDWNERDEPIKEPPQEDRYPLPKEAKERATSVTQESIRNFFALAWTKIDPEREALYFDEVKREAWEEFNVLKEGFVHGLITYEDLFSRTKEIKAKASIKLWPNRDPRFLEIG